jgi:hypothetical protein
MGNPMRHVHGVCCTFLSATVTALPGHQPVARQADALPAAKEDEITPAKDHHKTAVRVIACTTF